MTCLSSVSRIVDSDNLYNVEVHVKGGLRSGKLEVNGRQSEVFSIDDMQRKAVVYYHDGRDATEDKLILRITDGERNIRGKFKVQILQVRYRGPKCALAN